MLIDQKENKDLLPLKVKGIISLIVIKADTSIWLIKDKKTSIRFLKV